jgi:hypothetical protein
VAGNEKGCVRANSATSGGSAYKGNETAGGQRDRKGRHAPDTTLRCTHWAGQRQSPGAYRTPDSPGCRTGRGNRCSGQPGRPHSSPPLQPAAHASQTRCPSTSTSHPRIYVCPSLHVAEKMGEASRSCGWTLSWRTTRHRPPRVPGHRCVRASAAWETGSGEGQWDRLASQV